jgi:hypothetical protein
MRSWGLASSASFGPPPGVLLPLPHRLALQKDAPVHIDCLPMHGLTEQVRWLYGKPCTSCVDAALPLLLACMRSPLQAGSEEPQQYHLYACASAGAVLAVWPSRVAFEWAPDSHVVRPAGRDHPSLTATLVISDVDTVALASVSQVG